MFVLYLPVSHLFCLVLPLPKSKGFSLPKLTCQTMKLIDPNYSKHGSKVNQTIATVCGRHPKNKK